MNDILNSLESYVFKYYDDINQDTLQKVMDRILWDIYDRCTCKGVEITDDMLNNEAQE